MNKWGNPSKERETEIKNKTQVESPDLKKYGMCNEKFSGWAWRRMEMVVGTAGELEEW